MPRALCLYCFVFFICITYEPFISLSYLLYDRTRRTTSSRSLLFPEIATLRLIMYRTESLMGSSNAFYSTWRTSFPETATYFPRTIAISSPPSLLSSEDYPTERTRVKVRVSRTILLRTREKVRKKVRKKAIYERRETLAVRKCELRNGRKSDKKAA